MTISTIVKELKRWAPKTYAEDFDNVGLIAGQVDWICSGVLITLDTLDGVVDEAIAKKCNLIVSFHPIVFSGLKKFTGTTYVEKALIKAIRNDIAIYAIHTALDNHREGVNFKIGAQLHLQNTEILLPKKNTIKKITTYVPEKHADILLGNLHRAGAGAIGNYDACSFTIVGEGRFRGNTTSNPKIGQPGEITAVNEKQIHVLYAAHLENEVLEALNTSHPYEEVAYEITTLENKNQTVGMGLVGELNNPMTEVEFFNYVKKNMQVSTIRHSKKLGRPIHKVAVLGGSGSFAIQAAKGAGVDAFLTADLKYHQFFEAEDQMILMDIGHYESEQFTKNLIFDFLTKKFPNFAIVLSNTNTNPVNYF